jgi:hypothetical protein
LSSTVYARQIVELQSDKLPNDFDFNAMLHVGKHKWNIRDKKSGDCLAHFETLVSDAREANPDQKTSQIRIAFKGYAAIANFDSPSLSDIDIQFFFDEFLTLKKIKGTINTSERAITLSSNKKRILHATTISNNSSKNASFPNAQNVFLKSEKANEYVFKFPFRPEISAAGTFPSLFLEKVGDSSSVRSDNSPSIRECQRTDIATGNNNFYLLPLFEKLLS